MVERFELLDELKKEFESVSGPLSKIDELPDFVENRIWVEIQRLLERNAHLGDRLTKADNLLKLIREQEGMDRSKYVKFNVGYSKW